jgi:hypothetical protein
MTRRTSRSPRLVLALASAFALAACAPAQPLEWGVYVPDDSAPSSDLETVTAMAGEAPEYVLRFAAIGEPVPVDHLNQIADAGMTPVLTLEPWRPGAGTDQPDYTVARIAAGDHDADLTRWATELAAWGRPLLLRFAHEMNGDWYPWSTGAEGASAESYVAAWRHVHDIFRAAGAEEVQFVWAPNVPLGGVPGFEDAYPGADVVDVLGLDGYNWGDGDGHTWQEPEDLFGEGLDRLRSLEGEQPILVTETASAEGPRLGADKARWISDLVRFLADQDRVVGFIWFQAEKERDWRMNSTADAEAAFRDALAQRRRT